MVGAIDLQAAGWVNGVHSVLKTPFDPADHSTSALAVNDLGQIVGSDFHTLTGERGSLFWNGPSDQSPAVVPQGTGTGTPEAINDAGVIVGSGSLAGGEVGAVAWPPPPSAHQYLKGFDGGPCTTDDPKFTDMALDVSRTGAIVGVCHTASGLRHPVYWSDLNAVAIDLEPTSTGSGFATG